MGQKTCKIKPETLDLLVANTKFSPIEINEWHRIFLKEYPSGSLYLDDFDRIFSSFFPYGKITEFSRILFDMFDLNKNGAIDFTEFLIAMSILRKGSLKEKLKWAFEFYDLNNDTFISKPEMTRIIKAIYGMIGNIIKIPEDEQKPEQRVEKIFAVMDKDNDNLLTFNEFMMGIQNDPSIGRMLIVDPKSFVPNFQPRMDSEPSGNSSLPGCESAPIAITNKNSMYSRRKNFSTNSPQDHVMQQQSNHHEVLANRPSFPSTSSNNSSQLR